MRTFPHSFALLCFIGSILLCFPSSWAQAANDAQAVTHEPEPETPAVNPPTKPAPKQTEQVQKTLNKNAQNKTKAKSLNELSQNDLKKYLPEELKQLSKNTRVLWLEHTSAQYKGLAVFIPDWGQSAASPKQINQLRERLTHIGFTTLSLQPPAAHMTTSDEDSNLFQTDSIYKSLLLTQMKDIEQELANKTGFKLILSQGVNNAWLAEFYLNEDLNVPDAMVLLDAYFPELKSNTQMDLALSKLTFPLMDVTTRHPNQWQKNRLTERAILMGKQIKLDYRQQELVLDIQEERLFKSIYGWLNSLGWY